MTSFNGEINMVDLPEPNNDPIFRDINMKRIMMWDMMEDHKGNIWIVTYGNGIDGRGVYIIDPVKEKIKNIGFRAGLRSSMWNG